jgi:hypothetical protein
MMTADPVIQNDPEIQKLKSRIRKSSVLLGRFSDLHSDIVDQFDQIIKTFPPPPPVEVRTHGAHDLQVWESMSGKLSFSFDLQKPFYLPARLGRLLVFLASEAGQENSLGGLLGYRSRLEIQAHLQKTAKPGMQIRRQYVNNVTNLLKAAILLHTGRDLIKSNNELGVRLLLKIGGLHGLEATTAHKWL